MDSITQGLLGAAIAEAAFRPKLGWKAVVFGAGCGLLPDADVLARFFGELAFITYHRSFSHSLIILTLCAPLIGWLGFAWAKKKNNYWDWTHLAFWALTTHALLDWCTSYGTQLLWPFTNHRYAIDAIAILDPIYSFLLALSILVGLISRIPSTLRQKLSIAALSLSTLYLTAGFTLSKQAHSLGQAQLHRSGFESAEVRAIPTMFNILVWRIVGRDTNDNLRVGYISVWKPGQIQFTEFRKPNDPLVTKILSTREGRTFNWFTMNLLSYRVEHSVKGAIVELGDQRMGLFTDPGATPFVAQARFDAQGKYQGFERVKPDREIDLNEELRALWYLATGHSEQSKATAFRGKHP